MHRRCVVSRVKSAAVALALVLAAGPVLAARSPAWMAPRTGPEGLLVSELARRWQGAWVVRNAAYPGEVEAWNVRGNTVTVYLPASGHKQTQRLTLQSPCRLVRSRELEGGGKAVVATNTFAFAPDGPHVGPAQAAAGVRRGSTLTMCIGDHVYTYDERSGSCQRWSRDMSGSPLPAQAECVLVPSPRSFVLRRLEGPSDVHLNFAGDALLSPAIVSGAAEHEPTFFAAIQRANALVKR